MPYLVLEFIVRTSLIAAATALVLWLMRIKTAAAQHIAWTGVLLVTCALPAWDVWGPKAPIRILPDRVELMMRKTNAAPVEGLGTVAQLLNENVSTMGRVQSQKSHWQSSLFVLIYWTGVSVLLIRLVLGTIGAIRLARGAVERGGRLTSKACAAPITIGWFHPTVILPNDWINWPEKQVDAVLTHESEHARRRDPLIHWLALLGRALFWFHPLVWWLERRLSHLAEQACDAKVLAGGHAPREYAEYLLEISRSVTQASTRVSIAGLMMPGSLLQHRLRQILCGRLEPRASRFRMVCTAVVCALASALMAAGKLEHTRPSTPQESLKIYRKNGAP